MKKPPIQKPKQTTHIHTGVRIPRELHAEIKSVVERDGTSMNAEIISRLKMSHFEARLGEITAQNTELKEMLRKVLDKI